MSDFVIENGVLLKYTGKGGDVVIPEGVTNIGYCAFFECMAPIRVTLPASLSGIGDNSFGACEYLTDIFVAESNDVFSSIDGMLCSRDGTTVLCCPEGKSGVCTVPEGVTAIWKGAFSGCARLTEIHLPQSLRQIDWYAFTGCAGLKSIVIPDGVKAVLGAFKDCGALQSVTLPEGLTEIPYYTFMNCASLEEIHIPVGVKAIGNSAFENCTAMRQINIPTGVEVIGSGVFKGCEKLAQVTIPESVTVIGNWAFRGCTALTEVTIPAGVEHIEQEAFLGCTALESIHVAAGNKTYHDDDGVLMCENEIVCCPAGRTREYVLPEGAVIGEGAFCGCERLRRIELPDEYATASQVMSVFAKREVGGTYPDTAVWLYLRGRLILSGKSKKAVEDYIKRKKADYADGILKRGDAAAMENFLKLRKKVPAEELDELIRRSTEAGTADITAVLLEYKHKMYSPAELEKLQRDALDAPMRERTAGELLRLFSYSKSSEKITGYKGKDPVVVIPARIGSRRVRGIENTNIFTESCHQITEVTVSEGIESIGMFVFSGPDLVSVTLPASVNRIHELAFTNCPNLTIHAPAGSYAEQYAKENRIPFEAV